MRQSDIPDHHHFARYANRGRVVTRDDGVEVITPDAFRKRADEDGISGSYFEFFGNDDGLCTQGVVQEWRTLGMTIRSSGRVALALTANVKKVGQNHNKRLRVRHEPTEEAPSYSQIRGEIEALTLLEALAREAVVKLLPCQPRTLS